MWNYSGSKYSDVFYKRGEKVFILEGFILIIHSDRSAAIEVPGNKTPFVYITRLPMNLGYYKKNVKWLKQQNK